MVDATIGFFASLLSPSSVSGGVGLPATVSAETTLDGLMPITSLDLGASINFPTAERGDHKPSRSGLRTPKNSSCTNYQQGGQVFRQVGKVSK